MKSEIPHFLSKRPFKYLLWGNVVLGIGGVVDAVIFTGPPLDEKIVVVENPQQNDEKLSDKGPDQVIPLGDRIAITVGALSGIALLVLDNYSSLLNSGSNNLDNSEPSDGSAKSQ